MVEQYKRKPNTVCSICQKRIYRRPVELKQTKGRAYCSSACFGRASRKEVPCIVCTKPILAGRHAKTCSRACSNKYRTGISYKLGRPLKDKVKNQRSLKLRLIKERGVTCERCGFAKLEILHVHHKDRDRSHNELTNLALICPNCHAEEHYLENSWLNGSVADIEGGVA